MDIQCSSKLAVNGLQADRQHITIDSAWKTNRASGVHPCQLMCQYRHAVGSCLPHSGIWSSSLLWSSDQCLPSSWQDTSLTLMFHLGMAAAFADHMFTASVWLINIPQLGHPRMEGTLEPCILNN